MIPACQQLLPLQQSRDHGATTEQDLWFDQGTAFEQGIGPEGPVLPVWPDGSSGADGSTQADCPQVPDGTTLALLTFDAMPKTTLPDQTGNHPGEAVGTPLPTIVPGRCGNALAVQPAFTEAPYAVLAQSDDWKLKSGSLDLWVRFHDDPWAPKTRGIISRDAINAQMAGHLTVVRGCEGGIVVRFQQPDGDHHRCSKPIPDDTWIHLAVNWGQPAGLQLFIDGVLTEETASASLSGTASQYTCEPVTCGTSTTDPVTTGIEKNDNPWVIGATSMASAEGGSAPTHFGLGGEIDQLRISSAPRDYATGP